MKKSTVWSLTASLALGLQAPVSFAAEVPSLVRDGLPAVEAVEGAGFLASAAGGQLRQLLQEADSSADSAMKLSARARWLPQLRQDAAKSHLDRILADQLAVERDAAASSRLWATATGLTLWQHHLRRAGPVGQILLVDAMEQARKDSSLALARSYAYFLCLVTWPPLRPDHADTPRLMRYVNAFPMGAEPLQSMLGLRPGSAGDLIRAMLMNNPRREPVQIGGEGVLQLSSKATPVSYTHTFDNNEDRKVADLLEEVVRLRRDLRKAQGNARAVEAMRDHQAEKQRELAALRGQQFENERAVERAATRSQALKEAWQEESDRAWREPAWDPSRKAWMRGLRSQELDALEREAASNASTGDIMAEQAKAARIEAQALEKALRASESPEAATAKLREAERAVSSAEARLAAVNGLVLRREAAWDMGREPQRLQAIIAHIIHAMQDRAAKIDQLGKGPRFDREKQWHAWIADREYEDVGVLPQSLQLPWHYAIPEVMREVLSSGMRMYFKHDNRDQMFQEINQFIRAVRARYGAAQYDLWGGEGIASSGAS